MGAVNFGYNELTRDFTDTEEVHVKNFGRSWATFTISDTLDQGSPHSISVWPSTLSIAPGDSRDVYVKLSVPVATAGGAMIPGVDPLSAFSDVAGLLQFTPVGGSNSGITLRVPYYMVPQAVSNVETKVDDRKISKTHTATATTTNYRGAATGLAQWFSWGIKDKRDHGLASNDIQAVGVTVYHGASFGGQDLLEFAISTNHRWSNAAQNLFDVYVDLNNDGTPDVVIQAADDGVLTNTGDFNGIMDVAVFDPVTGAGYLDYNAIAPTDSNTIILPVDSELLCIPALTGGSGPCYGDQPRFSYTADAASWTDGTTDTTDMTGTFNPNSPAVNNGMFDSLAPNTSATEALSYDPVEQALAPNLGWMVVTQENRSRQEAQLIPLNASTSHH